MEVSPGYKQTEVGVIPEDWDVASLRALLKQGPTNGWSGRCVEGTAGTPTLSLAATTSGRLVLNSETVKWLEHRVPSRSDLYLAPGDVLVQRSNTAELVGTTALFDGPPGEFVYPDLMMRLRFRQPATAHWFWRYANSANGRLYFRSVAAGSTGTMPKVSGENLREMPIPLPTRAEQEAIAEALGDADALIESLERLVAKKRQLKQGAMQELLTGKKRLPGFSEAWEDRAIFDLAGGRKELFDDGDWIESEHITSEGIRLVQTGNIGIGCFIERDAKKYIFESSFVSLRCKEIRQGDLLICRLADPAGRSCVLPDIGETKIITSVDVTIFRPPAAVANRVFLANVFSTDQWFRAVSDRSGGTTHKRISRGALGRLRVRVPSVEEQAAIAEILSDMDTDIAALEAKLTKARQLKQGMMQELLTGRIRLV